MKDRNKEMEEIVKPRPTDKQLWGIYITLCLISIVELYSASSFLVDNGRIIHSMVLHVVFLVAGLMLMVFLQRTHYQKFLRWGYLFAFVSIALMFVTLKWGNYINGARRSISLGIVDVQPAEMVKISAVLIIAAVLGKKRFWKDGDVSGLGITCVLLVVAVSGASLLSQGLTNTLLLMAISISMMVVGGVSAKNLGKIAGGFIILALVLVGIQSLFKSGDSEKTAEAKEVVYVPGTDVIVGQSADKTTSDGSVFRLSTWKKRIERHLKSDKWKDTITNENRQEQYSYIAQAHGGVIGVSPGNSRETARLPLAFTDYIYAIIIEELGLVGGLFVLITYLLLLARAGRIATRCQTAYPALLVIGMAIYITYQAMFHMAIVTGAFPVSGQPLPLISKGGTSILITSMALGIMLSVSRFAARKGKNTEIKEELEALPADAAENRV